MDLQGNRETTAEALPSAVYACSFFRALLAAAAEASPGKRPGRPRKPDRSEPLAGGLRHCPDFETGARRAR